MNSDLAINLKRINNKQIELTVIQFINRKKQQIKLGFLLIRSKVSAKENRTMIVEHTIV